MSDDKNLRGVYETLKKEGYTPPEFGVFVNDMRDEKNLRGVYETLKREGYTPPEFGVFRTDMFGAAVDSPQSSGPAVQQQSSGTSAQPQSSGSAAASQGNAVSGLSRAAVTGETEPVMDTGIFPDVTDAVAGDGIATAEAVQKEEVRTPSGQKSGGSAGSGTVGSNAVGDENRHAGTRLSGAEQLRVAAHELEAAEAAQRISDDSMREKKEAAAYRKMLLENARAMAERNKEGRRRADEEGIDWDAAIAAVEGKESAGGKESADGRRDSRGVVHEDVNTDMADNDAEVNYEELLSPQAAAKKAANDVGMQGRHVSEEETRAMSTEAPRGLYYHKDAVDAAGREPFAADTRVMNDPEDIYVTPAGSGIDPRGASADPIALPEVTVTGSSRNAIMKRVAEMRYLDGSLAEVDDTELRAHASSDLRKEREEAERRVEQFRTEHPGKWRGMSEDEREALRESMAGEVEFERLASTLDSRMAANRREQERRMAEIEKDVRESLAATPEGRRILAGRDSDMDVMRRVDLAAGYDSELRALRQEAWNLGALDEAKAASEGDGGRETVWNFMKGVGRGLRDIAVNPLGLRSMHNDATQLVRVAGKLKRGEELTETEQRAVESHFSRLAADSHYEKSQAGKAGEFTAALAEIAVEFGLNPASGAVRRTLTGIAREVGPAAVRATLMNAPVLLYKLGVSSASVGARRFAGNMAKVIGAAVGEGASATVTTQLARNLEESVGRSLAAPVYDGDGKLAGLSGDPMGNAMAKTFTASAGTNAAFMFPATFGGEAVKGIGRAVKYLDKRGMGLPFGNPVDAFVKMKSGEVMSVIASDAFGRVDGDPEMRDVLSEESARDMIVGLLAAEFTTGIMKSGAGRVRSLRNDVGVMRHESEVKVAAARMASLLRGEDGRVDKEGLMILGSVMRADKEMNPGEVAACLRSLSENGVPAETCQAVLDYLRASYRWKGAVAARERMRAAREERDWREGDLGEESRAGADPRSAGETSEQAGLQSDQAVQSEKSRQAAESAMRSGYEAEENGNAGDLLKGRQEAERMMADAFEYPDMAMEHFGEIDDAGGIVAEIWNNDKLNERQKKAAEAYVMSLLAAHGQEVRRADDRRIARDRIRDEVAAMTNREGNIQPVVLKADDRRVMVTSGELRLSDDGSTVLASESSPVIWVYDPEDGKKKAIYPGAVLSVEPVMSAEAETERRIRILEDAELLEDAARADLENADSGMNTGASASAGTAAQTEAGTESGTEASGEVRGASPEATDATEPRTPDIDTAIARAKEAMERFEEMFDGEQEYWLSIVNENPEEILSNPDLTDAQKDAAREYVEAMQDLAKADAAYGSMPEEKSGESGLESGEKSVILQHGDGSEQDNDGLSAADNGGAVAGDTARGVEADRDRSDIRVYEEGLAAGDNAYSKHSERNRREAESERLVEIARRNGQYRKREEVLSRGIKYTKGSGESEVVIDHENGRVYKIKDPYAKGAMKPGVNPEDAIYEHLVHNKYFPETAYRFEGIGDDLGDVRIILSQGYVESVGQATQSQIEAALAEKGLLPIDRYHYGNDEIVVTDVMGDNALLGADGKVYFIDPIINFKRPVRKIVDEMPGNDVSVVSGSMPDAGTNEESAMQRAGDAPRADNSPAPLQDLTPLQRIPTDEKGDPIFELAESPEVGWDALVEFSEGDVATAKEIADTMAEEKRKEYEKAQKLKPKGKNPTEILASKKANAAQLAQAEKEYNFWQRMPEVEQARQVQDSLQGQQSDVQEEERVSCELSDEVNEFGKPFVKSSDGTTDFGHIDEESGLTPLPIKLSLGENYKDEKGDDHGYGYLHIDAGHRNEILQNGFSSVEEFVETVARNYTVIKEGAKIGKNQTYLLEVSDEHNNTLFIQLSRDGKYWNVNSAGIFKKKYSRRKPEVYSRPAVGSGKDTDTTEVNSGQSEGATAPAGNSSETPDRKVTDFASDKQEIGAESSGEWREMRRAFDRKLRDAADRMRDCPEALDILSDLDPHDMLEVASVVLSVNKVLLGDSGGAFGARRELGLGSSEQKKLFGLFASAEKGGKSIQKLAEDTMQEWCEEYGVPYDNREARDALLEIIRSHRTRGEIGNYIRERRLEQASRMYRAWEDMLAGEEERAAWEHYGMSLADLEAYNEMRNDDAREHLEDLDEREYNATFADAYLDREQEYDRRTEESAGSGDGRRVRETERDESSGEREIYGRGHEVLSGEKSDQASGAKADGRSGIQAGNGTEGTFEAGRLSAGASRGALAGSDGRGVASPTGEPTDAQKAAGNYKMEHRRVDGHNVSIENPKGSVRRGKTADAEGKETPWETTMQNDYGYIRGTQGVDGDHIDVFLSDTPEQGDVFVVDQLDKDGNFDEHKVMYGFPSEEAAREAYLSNYEPGWNGLGAITHVSKEEFKKWIGSSKRKTKPFADYKSVRDITYNVDQTPTNVNEEGMIVDAEGKPLTLYHGTPNDVELADLEMGHTRAAGDEAARYNGDGISFTPNRDVAEDYASQDGGKGKVFDVNVTLKNPYYTLGVANFTPEEASEFTASLQAKGHDGIINYQSKAMREAGANPNEVIVFDIKSATRATAVCPVCGKSGIPNYHSHDVVCPQCNSDLSVFRQIDQLPDDQSPEVLANIEKMEREILGKSDKPDTAEAYTITPTKYEGKRKTSDVWFVKFNRELTAEEKGAFDTFVRGQLIEGRKTSRGWYDRKQEGYMMRSEEAARQLGEMLGNEEAVADAQPLSREDIKRAGAGRTRGEKKPVPKPANTASVEEIVDKHKEAPAASAEKSAPRGQFKVTEEMKAQEDELRKLLGIDDDEGSTHSYFRDPDELTPEQKRRVFSLGVDYAFNFLDNGVTTFPDFAKAIVGRLGSKVKLFIKSWYEGAKRVPGYGGEGYTDTAEVDRFDIENFDKPSPDAIRDAAMRVAERKAKEAAEQAERELIAERNEQRKAEEYKQARDNKKKPEGKGWDLNPTSILSTTGDGTKVQISKQMAKANLHFVSLDFTGVKSAKGFIAALSKALGTPDGTHSQSFYYDVMTDSGEAFKLRLSNHNANAANHDGMTPEISIVVKSGRQPNRFYPADHADVTEYVYFKEEIAKGDGQTLSRIAKALSDMLDSGEYKDMSGLARVNHSPNSSSFDKPAGSPGDTFDKPADATATAVDKPTGDKDKKPAKKKTIKPEQPVADLFGGLFDEPISTTADEKKTDVQPRSGSTERERGHQPQPNGALGESQRNEVKGTDGRGMGGRDAVNPLPDGERGAGVSRKPASREPLERLPEAERKNSNNNHAERGTDYAPKGGDARIKANIDAIQLAKQLLEAGEQATPEQMAVLRRFSGWGGLGKAFKDDSPTAHQLLKLLGAEAYETAVMSRNSAYYTPAEVIDTMWDVVRAMGFKGGNVLEGSAGIGNILGLMPADFSERSNIHAIEIDQLTGGILSLLYPDAKVDIQGFEKTKIRNNSVDLAITNVPFVTGLNVMDETGDKDLSKKFRDIHDFCIAKNIRKLREGGIGIFITSSGTMDNSARLRQWITSDGNADVVGAFRMHNKTFGGTGATSDIIVVRKRVNGKPSPNAINIADVTGLRTADYDTGDTRKVAGQEVPIIKSMPMEFNKYFVEHPENMAGEMMFNFERGETWQPTSKSLFPTKGKDQSAMLKEWAGKFADMKPEDEAVSVEDATTRINERLGEDVKEGSMVLNSKGELCVARLGEAEPIKVNKNKVKGHTKAECFQAYTAIKKALKDVLDYQASHDDNEGLTPLLKELNGAFDSFTRTYGNLHKNTAISFLRNDVDFSSILALETYSEKGDKKGNKVVKVGKTDIFSRRVIENEKEPQPGNIKDGILASLYKSGGVDVEYIADALGKTPDDVRKEIVESGLGFENPATGAMEVSYQYLSGNVRDKLHIAEESNEDGRYDANVKALQRALPMTIPAHLIEFSLGSSWIDHRLYEAFVEEKTGIKVGLTNAGGTWFMKRPWSTFNEKNRAMGVVSKMCGKTIMGDELIEAAITNKTITVSKTERHYDGSTETITDSEATRLCATKVDEIRAEFKDWARARMQTDSSLAETIERTYNEQFNNYVPMAIPEEFVPIHFGGQVSELHGRPFALRPHQSRAVVRAMTQPILLAHEVGTGKTYTLITTAMEMRRLGTARKPMIVVQNATVGQFVESAKEIYPNAKVLTIEEADRTADGRRNFYAKIKYNDWDMIVVPQSVFERIPDSEEREMAYVKSIIEEKMKVLEAMKEADNQGKSMIVRQAEKDLDDSRARLSELTEALQTKRAKRDAKREAKTKQNAEVKALEMLDREVDDVENFDDMGIDAILVDEAHEYKHLGFATAMQRGVKGVDPSFSKKSQGVYLKAQAVLEHNNGRNVVFATGTPISNTAAEIWTFMRYLMPADTMKGYGIYYFDDFVRNFGNISQMVEFTTSGKFKENNRFAGYINLPELVRIWSSVADTVLTREAGGVSDKIPDIEGGKPTDIYLPQTRALRSIMKYVNEQLKKYDEMTGKEKKENSHIRTTVRDSGSALKR